jgi:hypothetical protein
MSAVFVPASIVKRSRFGAPRHSSVVDVRVARELQLWQIKACNLQDIRSLVMVLEWCRRQWSHSTSVSPLRISRDYGALEKGNQLPITVRQLFNSELLPPL